MTTVFLPPGWVKSHQHCSYEADERLKVQISMINVIIAFSLDLE